jgi:hypothetical protein
MHMEHLGVVEQLKWVKMAPAVAVLMQDTEPASLGYRHN